MEVEGTTLALSRERSLLVRGGLDGFDARPGPEGWRVGPRSPANLARLRELLPWLLPQPLGLRTSAGFGDRLGLATPGHIRALRSAGAGIAPVFAQQSIRENQRTGRTPQQVLDDAAWGVFEMGWREAWGADADHLKTEADVDACAAAGYTLYTFDPGERVRAGASSPRAKFGAALEHVGRLHQRLRRVVEGACEVEVSVDETEAPTTADEHAYIVGELHRLGVDFVSLAPRYPGRFEKGVDYIGEPAAFAADFAAQVEVMRELGPYKLSLHSGSDKFSVFGPAAQLSGGLVHLKTAGTSYLEALRCVARLDPGLLDEVYAFGLSRYPRDRASYKVSAEVGVAPPPGTPDLLDDSQARQVLHVTFGSVLQRYGVRIRSLLEDHPEEYAHTLESHFSRHLAPFAGRV